MISGKWRLALAAKALLLLSIAGGFGWLSLWSVLDPRWPVKLLGGVIFGYVGLFLAWAATRGFADAVVGKALVVKDALALKSRRSGLSVRLPQGGYAEYIFTNSWEPLKQDVKYTVTIGRYSRVIVQRPEAAG